MEGKKETNLCVENRMLLVHVAERLSDPRYSRVSTLGSTSVEPVKLWKVKHRFGQRRG